MNLKKKNKNNFNNLSIKNKNSNIIVQQKPNDEEFSKMVLEAYRRFKPTMERLK